MSSRRVRSRQVDRPDASFTAHPGWGEYFLSEIQVGLGPTSLLYRFFHMAHEAVLDRGVMLEFGSFETLAETNERHMGSWRSMVPLLDPRHGPLGESCFCILGKNEKGEVVATQAARLVDLGTSNLKAEGESGRLMRPRSRLPASLKVPQPPEYTLAFSGTAATRVTGRAVYSGAAWYRPDFRGRMLSAIIPRISRALALTRWNTDFTFSLVEEPLVNKGLVARYGYSKYEPGVTVMRDGTPMFEGALIWMPKEELLSDLAWFVSGLGSASEVDAVAHARRA